MLLRPRLLEALGRAESPRRLTAVQAPRGYGKTVLLDQWSTALREEGMPVFELFSGVRLAGNDIWCELLARLGLPEGTQGCFQAVLAWARTLTGRTVLIVDDFETPAPDVSKQFETLLAQAPHLHLVVAGRAGALRDGFFLTGQCLSGQDLLFSEEEAEALAQLHGIADAGVAAGHANFLPRRAF